LIGKEASPTFFGHGDSGQTARQIHLPDQRLAELAAIDLQQTARIPQPL